MWGIFSRKKPSADYKAKVGVNSRASVESFHRTEVWFDQQKNYEIPDHLNLKLESPKES